LFISNAILIIIEIQLRKQKLRTKDAKKKGRIKIEGLKLNEKY
jgi:hypothetical protein